MNEQDNVRVVQEAYEAFGRGDLPAVLDRLTEDIEWLVPGPSGITPVIGRFRGKEEVARFFKSLGEEQEILEFAPQEFIAQGDTVVALGRFKARVKATGRTLEYDWAMAFTLRGGRISRFREYFDTAAVPAAYGSSG